MNKTYFVTGIGTGIGKTVVSAVLTEKLEADYWKPIQSGDLEISDSLFVSQLITNKKTKIHTERYRLGQPLSPHLSARLDGIEINLSELSVPQTNNNMIIEGAGGLMVPLNGRDLILDFIRHLNTGVIVVSQNYLGSINHTLLTLEVLKANEVNVTGLVFNGAPNPESEQYIADYSGVKVLGKIPRMSIIDRDSIRNAGHHISI